MNQRKAYLRANAVIAAVQKRTNISQKRADAVHRGAVFDVYVDEGSDECAGQLTATDYYILKTDGFQLFLEVLLN